MENIIAEAYVNNKIVTYAEYVEAVNESNPSIKSLMIETYKAYVLDSNHKKIKFDNCNINEITSYTLDTGIFMLTDVSKNTLKKSMGIILEKIKCCSDNIETMYNEMIKRLSRRVNDKIYVYDPYSKMYYINTMLGVAGVVKINDVDVVVMYPLFCIFINEKQFNKLKLSI